MPPTFEEVVGLDGAGEVASSVHAAAASPAHEPRQPKKRDATTRHSKKRRSMAIRFYCGLNGSGKTATAIRDLLPSMDKGRPILSTVPIIVPETGELYENYIPFTSWAPILDTDFRGYDILMDEVTGIANSRDSGSLPRSVQAELEKLRKRDVTVSMTAPSFARVDTTLRDMCWGVVLCAGYMNAPDKERGTVRDEIAAWRPKRLIRIRTFDAKNYNKFDAAKSEANTPKHLRLRPVDVEWWWGPGSRVFSAYDSFGSVSRVGEVLDGGRCARCGGTRAIPKCHCDDLAPDGHGEPHWRGMPSNVV